MIEPHAFSIDSFAVFEIANPTIVSALVTSQSPKILRVCPILPYPNSTKNSGETVEPEAIRSSACKVPRLIGVTWFTNLKYFLNHLFFGNLIWSGVCPPSKPGC